MSADHFQLIDDTKFDISILKKVFAEISQQQIDQLNEADKVVALLFLENKRYYRIGISYIQFDLEFEKDGGNFEDDNSDPIRLVSNAFAHIFEEAYIHTTGSTEVESTKLVPQVSTIMRVIKSKDNELPSCLDEFKETNNKKTSLKEIRIENPTLQASKAKVSGHLRLEHSLGVCKTLKK